MSSPSAVLCLVGATDSKASNLLTFAARPLCSGLNLSVTEMALPQCVAPSEPKGIRLANRGFYLGESGFLLPNSPYCVLPQVQSQNSLLMALLSSVKE